MTALVTLARLANERRRIDVMLISMRSDQLETMVMLDEFKRVVAELKTEADAFAQTAKAGSGVVGTLIADVRDVLGVIKGAHDDVKTVMAQAQGVVTDAAGVASAEVAATTDVAVQDADSAHVVEAQAATA